MVNDFGHVALDINGLRESDTGIYECRAVNNIGEAVTTASVTVQAKGSLVLDSNHPEGMKKIAALESKATKVDEQMDESYGKPVFTTALTGNGEVVEGKAFHLEARVVPIGDPNMNFVWTKNGEQLQMGSRIRAAQDFGFVTLDILSCISEDSGMYMVTAENVAGHSSSSFALHVKSNNGVLADSMHPESYKKLSQLEADKTRKPEDAVDAQLQQPPVFVEQLDKPQVVAEGQTVHFAAKVEPKDDPNLKIEWEFNGKLLETGRE